MSFVDGTLNSFRVSNKRADYPNDTTATLPPKTLSISRVYQQFPVFDISAQASNTWLDVPSGDIVIPAGTHTLGYKVILIGQSSGTSVPFIQLRFVDNLGVLVPGTQAFITGANSNGTSGGGLTSIWGRSQITVASPVTYQLQTRRNGSANTSVRVNSNADNVTGVLTGEDDSSYIFLDTITYT